MCITHIKDEKMTRKQFVLIAQALRKNITDRAAKKSFSECYTASTKG
jgi:hypothetical protein